MRKVSEHELHAEECRRLASTMKDSAHKQQLVDMSEAWTMLVENARSRLPRLRTLTPY